MAFCGVFCAACEFSAGEGTAVGASVGDTTLADSSVGPTAIVSSRATSDADG